MRILILNWRDGRHPQAGGAETYLHETAALWATQGHEVALIAGQAENGNRIEDQYRGIVVVRVGSRFRIYTAARAEYEHHWRGWPDVVVEHINGIPFLSPLYVGVPVVAVVHHVVGRIFFEELPFPLALVGFMLERALPVFYHSGPVVTVSPSSQQALEKLGFAPKDLRIIPNGIRIPNGAPDYDRTGNSILYLGRIKRYKGLPLLVRAAKEVAAAVPDFELLIAGRGDYETELRGLIARLGLGDNVRFLGYVTEAEKAALLRRSKILVTASEREGWGLTILEAASYGTPTVGFDAPGIRDAIRDGETGVLVPRRNPSALAHAIAEMLVDNQRRSRMGQNAFRYAQGFRWDQTADLLLRTATLQAGGNRRSPAHSGL